MFERAVTFLLWTLLGTLWLLTHFACAHGVWASRRLDPHERWLGMIPPLTPIYAWLARKKVRALLWLAALLVYLSARLVVDLR